MSVLDELEIEEGATDAGEKVLTFTLKSHRRYRHATLVYAPLEDLAQTAHETLSQIEAEADRQAERIAEFNAGAPVRNAPPCGCMEKIRRSKGKKSLGLVSLGKALLGPRATPEEAARRLAICQACQATDPTGARFYRLIDGKAYCGVPRLFDMRKVYRNEREWGCGCELEWKVGMEEARCPLRRWVLPDVFREPGV